MCANSRIKLLPESEINEIYALPSFNEVERLLYFDFTTCEIDIAREYRTIKAQVYFMLSLGYFKAKQQFYFFDLKRSKDAQYVFEKYFNQNNFNLFGKIDYKTYHKQKNDILKLLNYKNWSQAFEPQIESHICELLRYYPKCHNALRQLLGYFDSQQIVIPTYRKLQDMFTAAFSAEEKRVKAIILSIPKCKQELLSALIDRDDGISQLNIIRADQKDFKYTAVKTEVMKAQGIVELYEFTKDFIPTLKLSKNAIRYYADVAEQYTTSRLKRLSKSQQWLHIICFIYNRYQQILDNLITTFTYHVRATMEAGKAYAEAALIKYSSRMVADFPKLSQFLKWFPTGIAIE